MKKSVIQLALAIYIFCLNSILYGANEPILDTITMQVHFPKVEVGDQHYQADLSYLGNNIFTINSLEITDQIGQSGAQYNGITQQLTIPVAIVGNERYQATMTLADNNQLILNDAQMLDSGIELKQDFVTPEGKFEKEGEGPWNKRLMIATSSDGLNYTALDKVLANQANVPDMVKTSDDWIWLYFSGWTVGDKQNVSAVMISPDYGNNWYNRHLTISGYNGALSDPDVVILDNQTIRLFFTGSEQNQLPAIHYADSSDGINFEYKGIAYSKTNSEVLDSTTIRINDQWHMYLLNGEHVQSSDGQQFQLVDSPQHSTNGQNYFLSNELLIDKTIHMFGFAIPNQDIRSFVTTDGSNFEEQAGSRLTLNSQSSNESQYIKDPALIQFDTNHYLMIYVTVIP